MRYDCPFCHHDRGVLYRDNQELQSGGKRDVYLCTECRCLYSRPRMDEQEAQDYMSRHYARVKPPKFARPIFNVVKHKSMRWVQPKGSLFNTGLLAQRFKVAKGNVLDIGANTGSFCLVLKSLGYDAYGVDLFEDYVRIAREMGVNVFSGSFPNNIPREISGIKYTMISILETIYNIVDLREGIRKVHAMLEPNGFFLIKCHQGMSAYYKGGKNSLFSRLGDSVQAIPTVESLRMWLENEGFEIVYFAGSLTKTTAPFRINERTAFTGVFRRFVTGMECLLNKIYEVLFLKIEDADQLIVLAKKRE